MKSMDTEWRVAYSRMLVDKARGLGPRDNYVFFDDLANLRDDYTVFSGAKCRAVFAKMKDAVQTTEYTEVTKGDINLTITGSGSIESSNTKNIASEVSAKVKQVNVKVGDKVNKGDVLFVLDSSDLDSQIRNKQKSITSYQKSIIGYVSEIGIVGTNMNSVTSYPVTITLDGREDIMMGMNCSVEIVVESSEDALVIPVEAVSSRKNKYYVTMEDGTEREVEIGIYDEDNIEITSGLSEGEKVKLPTKVTAVPSTTEKSTTGMGGFMNGGGMPGGGSFPSGGSFPGGSGSSSGGSRGGSMSGSRGGF